MAEGLDVTKGGKQQDASKDSADRTHLSAIRIARDEVIDTTRPPASSAVQVAALFRPDLLLEIEAYAVVPDRP